MRIFQKCYAKGIEVNMNESVDVLCATIRSLSSC